MGISLGWVVFFAAGVTAAPPAERNAAQISYTVRMLEANGVGWREAVFTRLKPVARQGAATIWTLPRNDSLKVLERAFKSPSEAVIQSPRVTALTGVPATIQVRENQTFVTQVAWDGNEQTPHGAPQPMRVGWHTTLVGRKLDQGILVKMVLEDTAVLAVHKVTMNSSTASRVKADPDAATCATPFEAACPLAHEVTALECASSCCDAKNTVAKNAIQKVTTACADEKPADRDSLEKLAMNLDPHELAASMLSFKKKSQPTTQSPKPTADAKIKPAAERFTVLPRLYSVKAIGNIIELPEVATQEVLGEWLIPNGECLLVSFGPHTVADNDGKAVVRERLALVEANEAHTDVMVNSAAPFRYIPAPPSTIAPHHHPAPPVPMPGPPVATELAPVSAPVVAPAANLPTPPAPSRTFPQGIHTDGSKAKLPPLPDDEMEDESAESESAEPLPSPQAKKPRKPKPEPVSDAGTTKASFTQPKSSTVFLPSVFLPGASVGFQFLLPVKPLSLRLPFNQRLEIEIFGRVIPDKRATAE